MPFFADHDAYFEIQQNLEKIKKLLRVEFNSQPIYDEKYSKNQSFLKTKSYYKVYRK